MGCTASKIDNEDTVRRCKDRRRLIKDTVQSRHHLASAHSDYLRSLLSVASSLSSFAKGEPLSVSEQSPLVFLHHQNHLNLNHHPTISSTRSASSLPPPTPLAPPPPPPPPFSPSPSVASSKLSSRSKTSIKTTSTTTAPLPTAKLPRYPTVSSGYSATPSQSSSAWDWENFYPPSPPDSDFFNRLKEEREREEREREPQLHHHLEVKDEEGFDEQEVEYEEDEQREEEIQDHHQHYASSTTSSSTKSEQQEQELDEDIMSRSRSDRFSARSEFGIGSYPNKIGGEYRSETGSSSAAASVAGGDMRMVVRHRDLKEIVAALEEYFVKAAVAGEQVSEVLETGKDQLDRSFRQLRKTVYHSNSVLNVLSSTWSSKPPLAIKYRLDAAALEDSGSGKSHGSTLERLLAWEKKLYEEVKSREGVKIEHEKKLSTLQSLEYRGKDEVKIDKTKASIQKLQSLILVTSQAVSSTSVEITKVRDNELAPQLVNICYSLLSMWRSINQCHVVQNHIVQQVQGLVNRSSASDSTSDLHRVATRELEAAVSAWHSNFNRLIKYQRDYVRSLYGWLKLTLIHVGNDDNHRIDHSSSVSVKLTTFVDEWKQALDRLPDTVASEAIKSFVNVIHVIYTKQEEELRIKKRTETYSRELDKKSTSLRAVEKKFYQSYSTVGIGISGAGHNGDGQVFDSRDPLADKKHEIAACRRKVAEEMMRHDKAVEVTRSMTLNNIQTGLPGVFQAMAGFSGLFAEAMEGVCQRANLVL